MQNIKFIISALFSISIIYLATSIILFTLELKNISKELPGILKTVDNAVKEIPNILQETQDSRKEVENIRKTLPSIIQEIHMFNKNIPLIVDESQELRKTIPVELDKVVKITQTIDTLNQKGIIGGTVENVLSIPKKIINSASTPSQKTDTAEVDY